MVTHANPYEGAHSIAAAEEESPSQLPEGISLSRTNSLQRSLSRYRSTRNRRSVQSQDFRHSNPVAHLLTEEQEEANEAQDQVPAIMNRAKSRYRNQRPATSAGEDAENAAPASPPSADAPGTRQRAGTTAAPPPSLNLTPQQTMLPIAQPLISPLRSPTMQMDFQPDAKQLLAGEKERLERQKILQQAELRAQKEAETAELRRKEQTERQKQERDSQARAAPVTHSRKLSRQSRKTADEDEDEDEAGWRRLRQDPRQVAQEESLRNLSGQKVVKKMDSIGGGLQLSPRSDPPSRPDSPIQAKAGIFGMFKRRRAQDGTKSMGDLRQTSAEHAEKKANFIKQGGGGIVPGTDAPVSAVNAGDRRVRIELNESYAVLPLNPETTPQDLIRSATNVMSQPINPTNAYLVEHFVKVGLHRPLRQYEHVRDVLNSWDEDTANSLLIMHSEVGESDAELTAAKVPKAAPAPSSGWPMTYSQKPGKWDKRYVTLDSDGQIWSAKNEEGKDKEKVCHMSDFDVYTPTPKKIKKVRPPKKICFAIKSQQKSSMFMNTTTFVHFFCCSDKTVADLFYRAVQTWRSWYLVNVLGEGARKRAEEKTTAAVRKLSNPQAGRKSTDRYAGANAHRRQESTDDYYQLGTFGTLLDIEELTSIDPAYNFPDQPKKYMLPRRISGSKPLTTAPLPEDAPLGIIAGAHTRNASIRQRGNNSAAPPSAFRSQYKPSSTVNTTTDHDPSTSTTLGRTTSQRRRADRDHDDPSSSAGLQRNTSVRSSRRSSDPTASADGLTRRPSTRAGAQIPAKPLVDLTPQYKAPPQFQKKGKGFSGPLGPGGLVENATSGPKDAIVVPPSVDWRANAIGGVGAAGGAGGVGVGGAGVGVGVARPGTSSRAAVAATAGMTVSAAAAAAMQGSSAQARDRSKSLRGHGVPRHNHGAGAGAGPAVGGSAASAALLSNGFDRAAFTGTGLLAGKGARQGWGGRDVGHGVTRNAGGGTGGGGGGGAGNASGKPLLDIRGQSDFREGTLLGRSVGGSGGGGGRGMR